jgi:hypothetical protein
MKGNLLFFFILYTIFSIWRFFLGREFFESFGYIILIVFIYWLDLFFRKIKKKLDR